MDAGELKAIQGPLKEKYRQDPQSALITLRAEGRAAGLVCKVETGKALVEAGLHPATGGDGTAACSGDMLLEALVACAGVTLRAVATAIGVEVRTPESERKETWTSAAPSACRRRLRSASAAFACSSTSTRGRPRSRWPRC